MEAEQAAPNRAQRTRATVIFADLVGFTAISESLGAEHAYAVATGCLKLLDGIARKHGGAVDKYLGDSLMAVFGYPVPMPEASRAAVTAALEMRARVEEYNRELELELPLEIHIGVNTGPMIAGDIRGPVVREFHVLGDCVNVAARLKAKSPLGAIFVGPDTHAETRERFEFEAIEPLALKGKSKRVPAFAVLGSREPLYRRDLADDEVEFTALFGRDAELGRLADRVAALAEGHGGVVTLRGEEGMGKSRLLGALGAEPGRLEGIDCIRLSPPAAGSKAELHLIAGLAAAWAGVEPVDPIEVVHARLERAAARDLPEERPLAAALLRLLSARRAAAGGGDAALGPDEAALVARAIPRIVARLAGERPLLLAVDELRKADGASLAVLESLLPLTAELPLLLVLAGRSDEPLTTGRLLRAARELPEDRHEEIALGPLDEDGAGRLIDAVAGDAGLTPAARARLLERARGNPARILLGVFLAPALGSEQEVEEGRGERSAEAERRRSTILFADITGFTAMTEKLGPEAAYPIVAGALRLLDGIAREHGGTVDKYMGDCVMALFGVPEAIEDAPRAAVNAAIAMRRRIQEYNDSHGLPHRLDVHTGIHTGLGIAGDISGPLLREFAVMGEPVEVANLLTDRAEAGQVFVGPETWRFTRDRFEFRELDSSRLEGRSDEIGCYELLTDREQLHRGRLGSERQIFSELVGREAEMGRLREALAELRQGRGSVVTLVAEAGVGKSRLVAELRKAAGEETGWVEGRSLSNGAQLSYHPFADLIRQWAAIDDADDDEAALIKLATGVEGLLGEQAEEDFPFIASLTGMRLDPESEAALSRMQGDAREKRIRNAVTDVLRAGARAAPTVVVMDDLHWADQSSIELLESLLGLAGEQAVLFLNVTRPGFPSTAGRIREGLAERPELRPIEIELQPLDAEAARRMLNNLFRQGDIPTRSRAMIEEKAGGNPFYIEEVVRSLVDEGAVENVGGRFRATEKIHAVEIPGTIQEVVMARVDRLDLARRQLLQNAAVIGQNFHQEVLDAFWSGERAIEDELEELVAAEFLVPSDRLQGIEFAFKHPLIHEVTYDGILEARREELHRKVAESIELRLPETTPGWVGMLAYHFSLGRDAERAETYLFRAGDEAARVAASSEALHFFRQASKLYLELHEGGGDPAKLALLEKNIARALYNRGLLPEAEEHFNQALEHLGQKVPRSERALILGAVRNVLPMLTRLYVRRPWRKLPAASDRQREAFELMLERGLCEVTSNPTRFVLDTLEGVTRLQRVDPETVPVATRILAGASTIFSYGGLSFGLSRRCLEVARQYVREDDARSQMMYRLTAFLHHCFEGDWGEEHEVPEELVEETFRDGLLWDGITYLGPHGDQQSSKGNFARARERLEQIAKIRDQYDYDLAKSTFYSLSMFLALEEGRLEDALAEADVYYDDVEEDLLNVHALGGKAKAQTLLGDLAGAERTLALCDEIVERVGRSRVPPFQASNYLRSRLLFDVTSYAAALAEGDARRAIGCRRSARRSVRPARNAAAKCAGRRTEVYRLCGLLAWLEGDARGARKGWEESLAEGERLGALPELARTHAEIARRLEEQPGRLDQVGGLGPEEHGRRARELRDRLGLRDAPPGTPAP